MKYRVLKPMGFMSGKQGVTSWPGAIIEIDGNQAKPLVANGTLESVTKGEDLSAADNMLPEIKSPVKDEVRPPAKLDKVSKLPEAE